MDWADKLRQTVRKSPPPDTGTSLKGRGTPPVTSDRSAAAPSTPELPTNTFEVGMLSIPSESWLVVIDYMTDVEVVKFGRLCVYFRKLMLLDNVWRSKLATFEHEFAVSQGYPCCTVPRLTAAATRCAMLPAMERRIGSIAGRLFEHYFRSVKFHARDAVRRWTLKELGGGTVGAQPVSVATRLMEVIPAVFQGSPNGASPMEGGGDAGAPASPGPSSSMLLDGITLCMLDRGPRDAVSATALASFMDTVESSTPSCTGMQLVDVTESEDPLWLSRLLVALSPSHARALHVLLGRHPTLVELFQTEAEGLAEHSRALGVFHAAVIEPRWTRFFTCPRLFRRGVGFIVVDPMRAVLIHVAAPAHA